MRKIIWLIFLFLLNNKIYAIENIKIDNNNLIPPFSNSTKVYNFFTEKDKVNIKVFSSKNEIIEEETKELNEGLNTFAIESFIIRVYKNYSTTNEEIYLKDLKIEGYDILFDKNKYEYDISIFDEKYLNIEYELSNDNAYVSIEGNGNFNKTHNIITININNNVKYKINVYKSMNVSFVKKDNHTMISNTKKEIVKLIITTISSIIIFLFFHLLFINKTIFYI